MSVPSPKLRMPALHKGLLAVLLAGAIALGLLASQPGGLLGSLQAAGTQRHVLSAPLQVLADPRLVVTSGAIALHTPPAPEPLSMETLVAHLIGGAARLTLEDAHVRLDLSRHAADARVPAASAAMDGEAPLAAALALHRFERLSVRRATLDIVRANGRTYTLTAVTGDIAVLRKSGYSLTGTATLNGELVAFDIALSATADGKPGARLPFRMSVKAQLLDLRLDGRIIVNDEIQLTGPAEISIPNVRAAARWLGAAWPDGPGLMGLKAKGRLETNGGRVEFQKAEFQLDGNAATGAVALDLSGPRLQLEGTLALKTLDLASYAQPGAKQRNGSPAASGREAPGPAGGDLAMPLLKSLDADLRLSADRVVAGPLTFRQAAATLALKGGRLQADLAETEIVGTGLATGQLLIEASGPIPRFGLRGKMTGADLATLSGAVLGADVLSGPGDVTADVFGTGASTLALLATASGRLNLSCGRCKLAADVPLLITVPSPAQSWSSATRGTTTLEALEAKLTLAPGGQIRAETAKAETSGGTLRASGTIDLLARAFDLRVQASPRQSPPSAASTPTLFLSGPWQAPKLRSDQKDGRSGS